MNADEGETATLSECEVLMSASSKHLPWRRSKNGPNGDVVKAENDLGMVVSCCG